MKIFKMDVKQVAGLVGLFLLVSALMFGCAKTTGSSLDSADLISGWYSKDKDNSRWMAGMAEADFLMGQKGELLIKGYVPPDAFNKVYKKNLKLEVLINEKHITTLELQGGVFIKRINISNAAKKGDTVALVLKLNKSYIPRDVGSGPDERELGIIINDVIMK